MIVFENRKFVVASFSNEEELESVVFENAEFIFGADSILLPKHLIRSADGAGTIPDGFAIDFGTRRWFIVEAELASHSVWSHIAPQVSKQVVAAQQPASRKLLIEIVINKIREDDVLKRRIDELGVQEIDIRHVITEIIESQPIIGIPIDHVSRDLREWAQTLRNEVKLWTIRKLVDFNDPTSILYEIPDENRPTLDTTEVTLSGSGATYYDVSISDLVETEMLSVGERLSMSYKPIGGERQVYQAAVTESGELEVESGKAFSPSYAALHFIQKAGSDRKTVNGWTSWKTESGDLISELRANYLSRKDES